MNHPHLTIITGASRGLGLAMAAQRLAEGHRVLTIARRTPELSRRHQLDVPEMSALAERE